MVFEALRLLLSPVQWVAQSMRATFATEREELEIAILEFMHDRLRTHSESRAMPEAIWVELFVVPKLDGMTFGEMFFGPKPEASVGEKFRFYRLYLRNHRKMLFAPSKVEVEAAMKRLWMKKHLVRERDADVYRLP